MSLKGYSAGFFLLCAVGLLTMFSVMLVNPLLSIFAKEIGAAGVWIGLSVAGYWVSRVLLEVPSGLISSRFGYYKPMTVGLALTVVGNALCAYATNPVQLILARALMGMGAPLFFAVSMTFIVNLFEAERRGSALGLFQGIEFLGTILGSALSGYLITGFGFRGGFLLSAGLVVVALALILIPSSVRKDAGDPPMGSSVSLRSIMDVFTNRTLLIVSSATFAEFVMSTGVIYTIFPLYANEQLGYSLTDIGLIMGARSVGFVVAMLIMGNISDRVGRKPVLLFGLASTAVLVTALNFTTSFLAIAAVILLLGITTGAIWIVCPVLAAEAVEPSQRGAAIGTYRTFFDLGSVLGPIMTTAIMGEYGISACFYMAAALLIINILPSMRIREKSGSTAWAS
jgi:MFS family permease